MGNKSFQKSHETIAIYYCEQESILVCTERSPVKSLKRVTENTFNSSPCDVLQDTTQAFSGGR